jgi:hypothetical protein
MTRDDIIRMAREAGITFVTEVGVASATPEWIERFAALVAAAERKACIDDCHAEATAEGIAQRIIERIRARGRA